MTLIQSSHVRFVLAWGIVVMFGFALLAIFGLFLVALFGPLEAVSNLITAGVILFGAIIAYIVTYRTNVFAPEATEAH